MLNIQMTAYFQPERSLRSSILQLRQGDYMRGSTGCPTPGCNRLVCGAITVVFIRCGEPLLVRLQLKVALTYKQIKTEASSIFERTYVPDTMFYFDCLKTFRQYINPQFDNVLKRAGAEFLLRASTQSCGDVSSEWLCCGELVLGGDHYMGRDMYDEEGLGQSLEEDETSELQRSRYIEALVKHCRHKDVLCSMHQRHDLPYGFTGGWFVKSFDCHDKDFATFLRGRFL